jgi:hypothetical protein
MWFSHPDFEQKVVPRWNEFKVGQKVLKRPPWLKCYNSLKGKIKEWNSSSFGNIFSVKKTSKQEMEQIQSEIKSQGFTYDLKYKEQKVSGNLDSIYKREESCVSQTKKGGNLLETKIQSSMAKGRR